MLTWTSTVAHIVLTGLEAPAQADLGRLLSQQGHQVTIGWEGGLGTADALFCNGDEPAYPLLVQRVRGLRPDLPVVVVTRLPDTAKWLDALEAGAADYCCAPFETVQVCWLLSAVLGLSAGRTKPTAV
jgi:DNA-binding response OmpR family regulator